MSILPLSGVMESKGVSKESVIRKMEMVRSPCFTLRDMKLFLKDATKIIFLPFFLAHLPLSFFRVKLTGHKHTVKLN